jgi:ribosome-binding protein aMBF1 (putative translation factor)
MPFQMLSVSEVPGMIPASLHITRSFTLHNHPTGDPAPSQEDMIITHRLKEAGELLGIRVLDHIIVGSRTYYSFIEANTFEPPRKKVTTERNVAEGPQPKKDDGGRLFFKIWRLGFLRATGNIVCERRKNASMTQEDLSKTTGITRWHISQVERGCRNLNEDQARRLSAVLGFSDYRNLLIPAAIMNLVMVAGKQGNDKKT